MEKALSALGRAALELAQRGFAVFPLIAGRKEPMFKGSFLNATRDPEQIKKWWGRGPQANIGIATGVASGCFVVDVDRHDADGFESLKTLEATHGPLPQTLTASTPRMGQHLFFKAPIMPRGRGNLGEGLPGLEVKSSGGYVVAVPSVWNNRQYEWFRRGPIAAAPAWLIDLIAKPTTRSRREWRPSACPSAPLLTTPASKNQVYAQSGLRKECDALRLCRCDRMIALNNATRAIRELVDGGGVSCAFRPS